MKDVVDIIDESMYGKWPVEYADDCCPFCGVEYDPERCPSCPSGFVACACGTCDNPDCSSNIANAES